MRAIISIMVSVLIWTTVMAQNSKETTPAATKAPDVQKSAAAANKKPEQAKAENKTAVEKTQPAQKVADTKTEKTSSKSNVQTQTQKVKPADTKAKEKSSEQAVKQEKKSPQVKVESNKTKTVKKVSDKKTVGKGKTDIVLSRAAIAKEIKNHEPQGVGNSFSADTKEIYCFTHFIGATDTVEVAHKWYHNNKLVGYTPLKIRSNWFRTYSSREIPEGKAGEWKVEIVNSQTDEIYKTLNFVLK